MSMGFDRPLYLILGRGEDEKKVGEVLATASQVPGFVGFAVGGTVFWQPLINLRTNKITRDQACSTLPADIANSSIRFSLGRVVPHERATT
jgi:myo-inositol catabolism protein IolC